MEDKTPQSLLIDILSIDAKVAEALVSSGFSDIGSLKGITVQDLLQIEGVGSVTASKIVQKVEVFLKEAESYAQKDGEVSRLSCFGSWVGNAANAKAKKCSYCPDHRECKKLSQKSES